MSCSVTIIRYDKSLVLLEFSGDYVNGLLHYERALNCGCGHDEKHNDICQSGIARCAIGSGDIHKGISLCQKLSDIGLMKQCAVLLEANKVYYASIIPTFSDSFQMNLMMKENLNLFQYYLEAAELFECSGNKDQAAVLFARLKNWNKVSRLIHDVTQPKVHIAYAKVKPIFY